MLTEVGKMDEGTLEDAIALAASLHKGQVDKAGQCYILHPLRVMLSLDNDRARIAAVLHDTVEDSGLTLETIGARFGADIAEAVDALTKREAEDYPQFIERCGRNLLARTVKLADIGDNSNLARLAEVTPKDFERVEKYRLAAERLREMDR
jgi:(p)ppGpp synthase/HD superfamily hydrolase